MNLERVGISLVEVRKRIWKSVIWIRCKRTQKGLTDEFYGFKKSRKRSGLVIDFYLIANRKNTKGVVFLSKTVYKIVKKKMLRGTSVPGDRGSRVTPILPINFSKR